MKTNIFLIGILVAIFATSCAKAQQQAQPQPGSGIGFPWLPFPRPQFPFPQPNLPNNPIPTPPTQPQPTLPIPMPTPTPPTPQQGQIPQVPGMVASCGQALLDGQMVSCILDIINSSFSHQIHLSPGCCSLLTTCRPSVPAQQNPFLELIINQYCH